MSEKQPVALWKGIVGTALSGTLLLVLVPFDFLVIAFHNNELLWLSVTLLMCTAVCLISLILSLFNLVSTINSKKSQPRVNNKKKESEDNLELLHKLLSEGKITIEEYDKLRNK